MAGPAAPEPKPDHGWKATVAGLVFSASILAGFGVVTAVNHEDNFEKDKTEESSDAVEEGDASEEVAEG